MKLAKGLMILLATHMAFANAAAIDSKKSSVTVTFKQLGVDVAAKFNDMRGTIDFDPANPAAGKANISVAVASFDLGAPEYNSEVRKSEWLNSTQFPQATFVSSSIQPNGPGKLLIHGKLSVKGKVGDVSVPANYKQEGKSFTFEGQLPIKRLAFNIGEGEWTDTSMLADEVLIKFKAVTTE